MKKQVLEFLKELRESADVMYDIFTTGSCFRLYFIMKTIWPRAVPHWSDIDGHCIVEIGGSFYDIGGEIGKEYMESKSYYKVPSNMVEGYRLLKFSKEGNISVSVEKYKKPTHPSLFDIETEDGSGREVIIELNRKENDKETTHSN